MKKREVRMFSTALRIETRADGDESRDVLVGHAAVFNQRTSLGFFDEVVKPGAFTNTLKEGADVRALVDHDPSRIIGRSKDGGKTGTLRMKEDNVGLHVSIDVADTGAGRDLMKSVRRGDVDGMSFGFFVREDGDKIKEEKSGRILRELRDLDLFDVSPVSFPAYEGTDLGEQNSNSVQFEARSIADVYESMPEELRKRAEKAEAEGLTEGEQAETLAEMVRGIVREEVRSALKEVVADGKPKKEEEKTKEEKSVPAEGSGSEKRTAEGEGDTGANGIHGLPERLAQRKREILQVEHERNLL